MFWLCMAMSPVWAGEIGADPETVLREARRSLRSMDLDGVRLMARQALAREGAHREEASYLLGLAWQLDDRPLDALAIYREAYARHPGGAFNDQLEFGIAETLAETGEPREALRWLRMARRGRDLSDDDASKFAIDKALFTLQRGRLRKGTRKLLAALEATDHDHATWHQARARTWFVEQWLDLADDLDLDDPTLVERRAVLLQRAQDQVVATAHLPHDRFILRQIQRLGLSYERLGDDVISQHGEPAALPDEARKRVENVWVKATRTYDIGVRHAARTAELDEQARFEQLKAKVMTKVDDLP